MKWKSTNIPMENWSMDVPEDEDLGIVVPPFEPKESTQEAINKRIEWEKQHEVKTKKTNEPITDFSAIAALALETIRRHKEVKVE